MHKEQVLGKVLALSRELMLHQIMGHVLKRTAILSMGAPQCQQIGQGIVMAHAGRLGEVMQRRTLLLGRRAAHVLI